jgi:hypothetical protein
VLLSVTEDEQAAVRAEAHRLAELAKVAA